MGKMKEIFIKQLEDEARRAPIGEDEWEKNRHIKHVQRVQIKKDYKNPVKKGMIR